MVFEKVKTILVEELGNEESDVTLESSISHVAHDLGADSQVAIDMFMSLEEEFDIDFHAQDIQSMITVGDLVHFLEASMAQSPSRAYV